MAKKWVQAFEDQNRTLEEAVSEDLQDMTPLWCRMVNYGITASC